MTAPGPPEALGQSPRESPHVWGGWGCGFAWAAVPRPPVASELPGRLPETLRVTHPEFLAGRAGGPHEFCLFSDSHMQKDQLAEGVRRSSLTGYPGMRLQIWWFLQKHVSESLVIGAGHPPVEGLQPRGRLQLSALSPSGFHDHDHVWFQCPLTMLKFQSALKSNRKIKWKHY